MSEPYTHAHVAELATLTDDTATFVVTAPRIALILPRPYWAAMGRPTTLQFTPEVPPVERPPAFAPLHKKDNH